MIVVLLVALLTTSAHCQDIEITNMPKGIVWCGMMHNLTFKYKQSNVPDGSTLKVRLSSNSVGENKVIAELGTVVAPVSNFLVSLPQPLPSTWFGNEKLKGDNNGEGTDVLFEIVRADKPSVSTYCSLCLDKDFSLRCCPLADAQRCGCVNCACATGNTCKPDLRCSTDDNKCLDDLPGNAEPCPDNRCLSQFTCGCPEAGAATCDAKYCIDTRNCPSSATGTFGCPCGGFNQCDAGFLCKQFFCAVNPSTPIAQQACKPTNDTKRPDACMQHPKGAVTSAPFSCDRVDGVCKPCVAGERFCICDESGACGNTADVCTVAGLARRCVPRTGCVGCPCIGGTACTDADVKCVANVCTRNTVASSTTTSTTATTTSSAVTGSQTPALDGASSPIGPSSISIVFLMSACLMLCLNHDNWN
jgi:hypothetical protein